MANKTYTVRVSEGAPDITSDQVAGWLVDYEESSGQLAADPGAGERSLRLSLDKRAVEQDSLEPDGPTEYSKWEPAQ